jgi:hypothetical protein
VLKMRQQGLAAQPAGGEIASIQPGDHPDRSQPQLRSRPEPESEPVAVTDEQRQHWRDLMAAGWRFASGELSQIWFARQMRCDRVSP